jgi:hypothetical protein
MKKLLFAATALIFFNYFALGQTVQGTITYAVSGVNTVAVYAKVSGTALTNVLFLGINITISIPDQSSSGGNPTDAQIMAASKISNLSIVPALTPSYTANPYVTGGRAYYSYIMNDNGGTTTTTWPVNLPNNPVAEFTFPSNSYFSGVQLNDLSTGGGPNQQMYWYVSTIANGDVTDYTNMFYGIPSDPPTNNGGASPSFVTIQPFSVLPARFKSFDVIKKNNAAVLNWLIENESAITDKYIIESSVNGVDFPNVVATIAAYNNGRGSNVYSFIQDNLSTIRSSGVIYYRVKQIDKDGKSAYTPIKNLRLDGKAFAVNAYPNPVKNFTKLAIDLVQDSKLIISLTDASGKQVKNMELQGFKGLNTRPLNLSTLSNGNYMLKVQSATETKLLPIVKVD